MKITLNGEPREVAAGLSITALLDMFGFKPEATVVERNADIVDRAQYPKTTISEGDTIELIRFVGGG